MRVWGHTNFLIAVASVQPLLSGLPPQLHEFARTTLIEAFAPKEAAALAGLKEQQGLAAKLGETMLQSASDLIDFRKADKLIAAARDDLAA